MELDNSTYKKIYEYLNSAMSSEDLLAFEETLSKNNELRDTVNILKKMEVIYSPEDWLIFDDDTSKLKEAVAKFRKQDVQAFSEKIRRSETEYKQKSKGAIKRIVLYASSIAAIGLLMFSGYFFEGQKSPQYLYELYNKVDDLPSFMSKNDRLNNLTKAELLFKEKKYSEAFILFKSIKDTTSVVQPNLLIYLALTEAELNNYESAINYLLKLEKSNTIDNHKSYWFMAMVYLKQGDKEKAISALNAITQNKENFNYEQAISLLEELN